MPDYIVEFVCGTAKVSVPVEGAANVLEAVEDSVSMVSVDWDDTVIVEVG